MFLCPLPVWFGRRTVVDGLAREIKALLEDGSLVRSFGGDMVLALPKGLAVDAAKGEVFVSDYGDPAVGIPVSIKVFNLSGSIVPAWVNASGTTGASWSSAQALFAYKTGEIASTHSVNNSATLPGLDPVGNIRCSYCHDVHELNLATDDTTSGKPYLRGSWQGNPYREDGAPSSCQSYASQGNFGEVPRGGTGATELGGYQIDQNNSNPTSGWNLSNSAGICMLCHTEDDGGNGVTVNTMNYFGTASDDWVGTNGHSNAVIGGTGSGVTNIFREDWRKPNDGYCDPNSGTDADGNNAGSASYCAGYPNMANQQLNVAGEPWGGEFSGSAISW